MSVMTATEMRSLMSDTGLLTGTLTVQQWNGSAWIAVAGWTAQSTSIAKRGVDKIATVPAAQTTRPTLAVPLLATVNSPGMPAGPYAARFWDDVGSQGLAWRVGLQELGGEGGSQWTALRPQDDGITAASETTLGVITAYKAPPDEPALITSGGDIQVQRTKDRMLIPAPAVVSLRQGYVLQSVGAPLTRFRIMTLDLLDALDDTNAPYWLEATLEPV